MSTRWTAALLSLVLLVVVAPIVSDDSAQPASRYSLTASLAEHGSVDLGPYRRHLLVDFAVHDGRLRSDKAPGQPILAVPAYLLGRAFGAESASRARVRGDLGLWWSTLWSATVPFAILVGLMFLAAARFTSRGAAIAIALMLGVGTMMLPHAVNLYGHDLAALFGFGAWLAISDPPPDAARVTVAGLLAGLAVLTEYETWIILAVLVAYLLVLDRRRVARFVLGATPPLAVLAWYQWRAFGAPWRTPAAFYNIPSGYSIPGVHALASVLFANRGLFIGAPIALIGLVGAGWLALTGSGAPRRHAVVAVAVAIPYLTLSAGWSGFPQLEYPGLRYVIPILPFLAVPLAALWDRLWRPMLLAGLVGAVVSVPVAATFTLFGDGRGLFPEILRRLREREFVPTVWSMALGRAGVAMYAVTVAAGVGAFVVLQKRSASTPAASGASAIDVTSAAHG